MGTVAIAALISTMVTLFLLESPAASGRHAFLVCFGTLLVTLMTALFWWLRSPATMHGIVLVLVTIASALPIYGATAALSKHERELSSPGIQVPPNVVRGVWVPIRGKFPHVRGRVLIQRRRLGRRWRETSAPSSSIGPELSPQRSLHLILERSSSGPAMSAATEPSQL